MSVCILLGTRPEIIKMSPLIRACKKKKVDYFILHTGQHYSHQMDKAFFEDLELEEPRYNLNVGSQEYRKQVGLMIREITAVLEKEKPEVVFVQGDTNSVLAGALASNKLHIPIGHHEAGLRSHDLTMLEETNRIITDHISDFLFAPTENAVENLREEGIDPEKVWLTGNTVVDAVQQNLDIAKRKVNILDKLKLKSKGFVLVTAHRAENVDDGNRLRGIIEGLKVIGEFLTLPIIFPIHPRTEKQMHILNVAKPSNVTFIEPLGYLEFLQLEASAKLIVTDSGGLQEEACILKVPCVTIRENTERPETLKAGINVLAGTEPTKILASAKKMLVDGKKWVNPFGDGKAGERIIETWIKNKTPP